MKKILFIVLFTIIVVSTVFLYYGNDNDNYSTIELVKKIKKKTNTENTYYYFNIWNTSCIPCVKEMPDIDSLAFLYQDKVDFIFITNETDEKIKRFLKEKNIKLTNCIFLNDEETLIAYLNERIEKKHLSYPTHIITDSKFKVIHHHTGFLISYIFDPILTRALKNLK